MEEKEIILTPAEAARQIQFLGYLNNKMRRYFEWKNYVARNREALWNKLLKKEKKYDL